MSSVKTVNLEKMADIVAKARESGKVVVHCHGVFDLLHIGHIRYFKQAKENGDILVVTVTPDKFVNKGPGRPAFPEDLRVEALASLDIVDYVAKNEWPTAVETIKLINPNYYVKGSEYAKEDQDVTGGIVVEREAIESTGGKLLFTDDIVFSSSNLINKYASVYSQETSDYLGDFSKRHSSEGVLDYLEKAKKLKVLVLGEAIIDEYQYCEAIGKSSKEPTLAVKDLYTEKFAGGILAVANHVSNFCDEAALLTFLGDENRQEEFIRSKLNSGVNATFLTREKSPTIVKKRLIEHYFFSKILEVYTINDAELCAEENDVMCKKLEEMVPNYDLVIIVDFGHSMMTSEVIDIVVDKAKFLAVNVQANAGNMGYNVISKYARADYVTMAEKEIRLEARSHRGDLKAMVEKVSNDLGCKRFVVTRGRHGSLCYSKDSGFVHIPAFVKDVVDRIGAGDAFLSISALCAVQDAPMEVVGFVGNAVGAWAVGTICNEQSVSYDLLCRQIETMLK